MTSPFDLHGLAAGFTGSVVAVAAMSFHAPQADAMEFKYQCFDAEVQELTWVYARDLPVSTRLC